jgi:glyoxylase-like metal-dependent hydrolase (beta-lactamase superfamily II)
VQLELELMSDGWCEQLEYIACQGGRFHKIRFTSLFALIRHPQFGPVVFDTGYTTRFFDETSRFPEKLYRLITPVTLNEPAGVSEQLMARGIAPATVRHVIVSHFHADHIGGLKDFPNARFHCARAGYNSVKNLHGFSAVKHAFLPGLMPADFRERAVFVEDAPLVQLPSTHAPFFSAHDLLGDGSLLAVDLPGHATGQFGIFMTDSMGRDVLLAADACWLSRQYRECLMPHPVVRFLVNWPAYKITLEKIHQLHRHSPALRIIPTHCAEIWSAQ